MTTDLLGALPRAPALGQVAAGLAVASAVVHLLLLDAGTLGSLVMVGMAAACLPCAWQLWHAPTSSVWGMTAAVDAGMLVLHIQMLAQPHHQHDGFACTLMWLGLGLVAGQLALAGTAAVRR